MRVGRVPGTTVDGSVMLIGILVVVNELAPGRQSYPEGGGDATDFSSAYYHPTGVPAHPIAEPEPLCTVRHPVCLARSYSGRSPSRDCSG